MHAQAASFHFLISIAATKATRHLHTLLDMRLQTVTLHAQSSVLGTHPCLGYATVSKILALSTRYHVEVQGRTTFGSTSEQFEI